MTISPGTPFYEISFELPSRCNITFTCTMATNFATALFTPFLPEAKKSADHIPKIMSASTESPSANDKMAAKTRIRIIGLLNWDKRSVSVSDSFWVLNDGP